MEPDLNNVMDAPRRYIETSRSVTSGGTLVTTTTTTTERMKDQKMESRYNGPYHPDNLHHFWDEDGYCWFCSVARCPLPDRAPLVFVQPRSYIPPLAGLVLSFLIVWPPRGLIYIERFGWPGFSVNAPRLWNHLPDNLRLVDLVLFYFKRHLKTHLFKATFADYLLNRCENVIICTSELIFYSGSVVLNTYRLQCIIITMFVTVVCDECVFVFRRRTQHDREGRVCRLLSLQQSSVVPAGSTRGGPVCLARYSYMPSHPHSASKQTCSCRPRLLFPRSWPPCWKALS